MAKGFFKKIAKVGLIAGGSILGLINPALGAPLIVAGTAINTSGSGSGIDAVSKAAGNLGATLNAASGMQTAGAASFGMNDILVWIQKNLMFILLGIAALFIIPKLFKSRRR